MMTQALFAVALTLMAACGVLAWVFVARYARVRWYATPEGRHLMKFTALLGATYSLSALFVFTDPGLLTRAVLSVVVFGWTAYELANRTWLLELSVRENRAACAALVRAEARKGSPLSGAEATAIAEAAAAEYRATRRRFRLSPRPPTTD